LGTQTNNAWKRAVQEEEVLDVPKAKLTQNLQFNPLTFDVHNVEGMVTGVKERGQGNSRRPGVMCNNGRNDPLADIKLNPEMRRNSRKILQSVHSVCDQHD
jgi:hypothetical protein